MGSAGGTFFVVATPLGNLEDMTFRAVRILKEVDLIAAEDTRHAKKLLNRYDIRTGLISCHEHNEIKRVSRIIKDLEKGLDIALISDAGTPLVSDPGYKLVKAAADRKIDIIPIPGCSAAIAGISVSGLPTDSFLFLGFLSSKRQKRKRALERVKRERSTLIFYESPRRISRFIEELIISLGDRDACLAREITKLHEEYIRGRLSYILGKIEERQRIRGECSLFVRGSDKMDTIGENELEGIIFSEINTGNFSTLSLSKQISEEYGLPKRQVYDKILELKRIRHQS